jgi:hypothetical protein
MGSRRFRGPRAPRARPTHPDHPGSRLNQPVTGPHRPDARAHHVLSRRGPSPNGIQSTAAAGCVSVRSLSQGYGRNPRSPNSNHALRRRNFADASASPRRSPCLFRRARPLSGILSVEASTVSIEVQSSSTRASLFRPILSLSGLVARRGPYGPLRPASGAARTRPGRALDAPRMCPRPAPDVRRTPGAGRRRTQVEVPGQAGRATDEASNGAGRGRRRRTRVRTRPDTDAGLPDATFRAGPSTGLVFADGLSGPRGCQS